LALKFFGAKGEHKMLMKLTPAMGTDNLFWNDFVEDFFLMKILLLFLRNLFLRFFTFYFSKNLTLQNVSIVLTTWSLLLLLF